MPDEAPRKPRQRRPKPEGRLIYNPVELGRELGFSPSKIRRLCRDGVIKTVQGFGEGFHIPKSERDRLIATARGDAA